jgi:glycosyltransferase involved in cell wall biosynthesis
VGHLIKAESMTSAKIVHLTSVHHAFDTRIFHKECKTLAAIGYDVTLVALCDQKEFIDGVRLCTVPKPSGRRERITHTVWQIYRVAWAENADIYHLHDPELIPIGFLLRLRGKKVVYDVHEDLPKSIQTKYWIPHIGRSIVAIAASIMEYIAARVLSGIVAATPSIAERFPDKKTVTVQNFPISEELFPKDNLFPYSERPNKVVYMGVISQLRGSVQMVEAMELLQKPLSVRLALAGSFRPPDLIHELESFSGWQAVDFLGWVSRPELRGILKKARIGLVLFHPAPNHVEAQPNKLFEFMSAGIPVVASNFPLWREIIENTGCGLVVNPLDPQAIANAIEWLLEHTDEAEAMGQRGRQAVEKNFNWENEVLKLLSLYQRLIN